MNRAMGCLQSPKDLRDYKIAKVTKVTIELPKEFQLQPTSIKDQGSVSSCVAHALSSMLETDGTLYSTGWIYGYRPDGYYQGEGMYPREALKTIKNIGAVQYKSFPYNIEMEQAKILVDSKLNTLTKLAKEEQILSYARLYGAKEIKEFLYQSKSPIPFVISTYNGIDLDMNKIMLPNAIMNETGNHMMLIIGWNEEGFIIQNSWGKDWGDQGLAILPYEYPIEEAWGVTLDPEQKIIVKPQFYWIRKIIQFIINLFINGLK